MFQMLTSDFRGDFGPEKFSVKHLKKLVDRDLKTEGWSKYLRGVSEEDYEQRIQKYQRYSQSVAFSMTSNEPS